MINKYPFKVLFSILILIILNGFATAFAQAPNISYPTPPPSYPINAVITPLKPVNSGGAVPATAYGKVSAFVGSGLLAEKDGLGAAASFENPIGIAVDKSGNFYVTDQSGGTIRKITTAGLVTTFAGDAAKDVAIDGQGTAARFNAASQVAIDGTGNIYIADANNNKIRKITPGGLVSTLAGTGQPGSTDGPANTATFLEPTGVAVDASGTVYIADTGNGIIRKISTSGIVSTFAGHKTTTGIAVDGLGTAASFFSPYNLVTDKVGNVYVTDISDNLIRKITPDGMVSTIAGSLKAGSNNGIGSAASFSGPEGITVDGAGNIYVSDTGNNLIRRITQVGIVTLLAGNVNFFGHSNQLGTAATFWAPVGLTVDANSNLFVADSHNYQIRKITLGGYTVDKPLPDGLSFDNTTGIITGTPTVASPATQYTITAYNANGYSQVVITIAVGNAATLINKPDISYQTPQVYTQNIAVAPLLPNNKGGNVPATAYGNVITLAGSGQPGAANGTGKAASFKNPVGVTVDAAGNVYIGDGDNNMIRKITPKGVVTTFAGSIAVGGGDGAGTAATFDIPHDLAIDNTGTIYVADFGASEIRKITPAGVVSTLAGDFPKQGSANGTGKAATFTNPNGVAIDAAGDVYVADTFNYLIRKITPAGLVTTFAGTGTPGSKDGTGTAASFSGPFSIAIDQTGNLFVTDGQLIRKITQTGVVTTFAGNLTATVAKDGTGTSASFGGAFGITIDQLGNLYVADNGNSTIREITPAGVVTTIAGTGAQGAADGIGKAAGFSGPWGIANDGLGNLYVADHSNNLVRKVALTGYAIDKPLPSGLTFDATTGTIGGNPTAASPATDYTITAYNAGGSSAKIVNIAVKPTSVPVTKPPNISYQTPQVYVANTPIVSLVPKNTGGPVPANIYGKVTILAGNGSQGSTDGVGAAATFTLPENILVDNNGNIYLTNNNKIRKITKGGVVSTIAGNGTIGSVNGPGASANFYDPQGITIDNSGNLYVADNSNSVIRKITPAGFVTTFAGKGEFGYIDGSATQAMFARPYGITVDPAGNLYVTDQDNFMVRKVSPNGDVSTIAGNGNPGFANGTGANAAFKFLSGIVIDKAGNLYVSDEGNSMIRKITLSGIVSTYAGTGQVGTQDGPALSATFQTPTGLAIDDFGNIYVADHNNNLLRKITPDGIVSTVPVAIGSSIGIAVDKSGNLFFADLPGNSFDQLVLTGYTIDKTLPAGLTFDPTTGIISGTPNATSPSTDYTVTAYNTVGSSSTIINITVNSSATPPPNISYQTPQVYTKNKSISPLPPANSGGAVSTSIYSHIITLAGPGFSTPTGVVFDKSGNLYVTEFGGYDIKKITPDGTVSKFAGSGTKGSANGPGTGASFQSLQGITIDASGNLYVTDEETIRKITPAGIVSTFSGGGGIGLVNGYGAAVKFSNPVGIVCDATGNIYVADRGNSAIRRIGPSGDVSTFVILDAGSTPTIASAGLTGLTIDASGNLYICDNNAVKMISPGGIVTTIAGAGVQGFANGTGSLATFNRLQGITIDAKGNLYVSDADNNMIRMITPSGVVTTAAGTGKQDNIDGSVAAAAFFAPYGLAIDSKGNLFVAGAGNNAVKELSLSPYTIDKPLPAGLVFDTNTGIISGTPVAASPATNYTITAYNGGGSSSTTVNITVKDNATNTFRPPVISYPTPNTYTSNTAISPLTPTNTGGAVPATFFGLTEVFAGTGNFGTTNGDPITASFHFPTGVNSDGAGNLYVADYGNNMIRKITPAGITSTFAGSGNQGAVNGAANIASFNNPTGVAVDATGNVYVVDAGNNQIRIITPAGLVNNFAGNAFAGSSDGTGIAASFKNPFGIAIDASGNLYVADMGNNLIRKITPAGAVTTLAGSGQKGSSNGTGTAASFNAPEGIAVDAAGNVYVADTGNNLIREISPAGVVTTLAGNGSKGSTNGDTANASFNAPSGIVVDAAGNIFISDTSNNLIRMITPQGVVSTLAGSGAFGGFNNVGVLASFANPIGLTIDGNGNLFVADKYNNQIRKVVTTGYYIDKPLPDGLVFDSSTGIISGTPTTPTPTTIYTITAFNEGGNGSTTVSITVTASPIVVLPPAITYQTPQVYHTNVVIAPLSPTNTGGAVPATVYGQLNVFAGDGSKGSADGTGKLASLWDPGGITIDAAGNTYFISNGSLIRKATPQGVVTTIAGSPNVYGSTNGTGSAARFNSPTGIAVDAAGNLYVADGANELIRKVTPAGVVTTFAGSGIIGKADGTGKAASFDYPWGITIDAAGNLYVTDNQDNLIRKITPAGVVTTIAGTGLPGANNGIGTSASFNFPIGIAVDASGNLYVVDSRNNLIRKITPAGVVSTFAGSGQQGNTDGPAVSASFNAPQGIFVDQAGNVYVVDTGNNSIRIITPGGLVSTIGANYPGATGNQVNFKQPRGIVVDNSGNAYITNELANMITDIVLTGYAINKPLPPGLVFNYQTGTISGTPTAASPATDYTITAYNAGGSSSFTVNIQVIKDAPVQQVITFPAITTVTYGAIDTDPAATSNNTTIPVTYTSSNTDVATIIDEKIHITGAGTSTITASQAGNDSYVAAVPVVQDFTVLQAPLIIAANNQTKPFGAANPVLSVTYTSFVYGENTAQLLTQPEISTMATTTSAPGDYTITVTGGTSNNYDIQPKNGVLTITPVIVVPNAFTPNGDGINDLWNIAALVDFPQCLVSVYSRYGSLIYQSRGYAKPWDGTFNGSVVPTGTYYYIIDPKNGQKQLSGSVSIIR